jgi:hypothetical protein
MNLEYYGNGKFEFICKSKRWMYTNAHNAITETKLWDWLRNYNPPSNLGFMCDTNRELYTINKKMREDPISENHSGCSYCLTMRVMQFIAANGYESFKEEYLRENPPAVSPPIEGKV